MMKVKNRKGYVAIETVIVAGLMIGIGAFSFGGMQESSTKITESSMQEIALVSDVYNMSNDGSHNNVGIGEKEPPDAPDVGSLPDSNEGDEDFPIVIPEELESVTESGKNILIVDDTGIQNAEGEAVTAEDVFTKAIEVAKPGDGIYLKAGEYTIESNDVFWKSPYKKYSNMIIRKNLTIIGEDPSNTTLIIDDSNSRHYPDGSHFAITFNAPNITLKNLTIKVHQEKTQSLWSVFNVWGNWDGSTSRGTTIENVRIETESPVPYLFYMNDYDINVKDVRVKSNGNIGHMFYWNYGNMNMSDSKFDMPMSNGYRNGAVKLDNTFFNVPASDLD